MFSSGEESTDATFFLQQTIFHEMVHFALHFGGTAILNEGLEGDDDVKRKVFSIAQDIVYAVLDSRKLTPKHIGLGLALHQATRSEALLVMFHAEKHAIGIDTVRRIDATIAQNILEKFEINGYVYIPDNIVNGRMIHCPCDIIDVLEASLDGKNTFHYTQMVVWQRGPEKYSVANCMAHV
ncbi:hypothetical protein EOD39_9044 [Acipenser ruthenus]|uniref:Uncharacterized protein n=1 Tax=Acipenser ruthenus TaxID=7906 RepID=A0A662YX20_ACIRT|nr:hypothetical protein EOD39_9044 [Acipenser ruthenus]